MVYSLPTSRRMLALGLTVLAGLVLTALLVAGAGGQGQAAAPQADGFPAGAIEFPAGVFPIQAEYNQVDGLLYVVNSSGLPVWAVTRTLGTPQPVIQTPYTRYRHPEIAVNQENGLVYAAADSLTIIQNGQVITTLSQIEANQVAVNPANGLVYANDDGRSIYVITGTQTAAVIPINAGFHIGSLYLDFAYNPINGLVYAQVEFYSHFNTDGRLFIFDGDQVVAEYSYFYYLSYPEISGSSGLSIDGNTGLVYLNKLYSIDVFSGTVQATSIKLDNIQPFENAYRVGAAGGYAYVRLRNSPTLLAIHETRLQRTLPIDGFPDQIAGDPVFGLAYAPMEFSQEIRILGQGMVVDSIQDPGALQPDFDNLNDLLRYVSVAPGGRKLFVANPGDHSVSVILLQPDYYLHAGSAWVSQPGGTVTIAVAVTGLWGYTQTVSLSTSGLPVGVTASIRPNPVAPDSETAFELQVDPTVAPGLYDFTITATSGEITHTLPAELFIYTQQVYLPVLWE